MKAGVRFCGGCNPRYDRIRFYENIKNNVSGVNFEYVISNCFYDVLLVVNGCTSACCSISGISYSNLIWVDSNSSIDNVVGILNLAKSRG